VTVPVFWFLGLSGSGKSTLSRAAIDHARERDGSRRWELLDGDTVRGFLGDDLGYSAGDRRKSTRITGLLAHHLSGNGIGVVVAHISPFEDLRAFMRAQIAGYREIYCRCPVAKCIERDPKGHYRKQAEAGAKDFVGLDIPFEEPGTPDLVIETADRPVAESILIARQFVDKNLAARP
jgi:adenylylsulfate kinase